MNRLLLGLWSRRATLVPLLLVTVTVVAGTVTALGFARAAGTSPRLVAPLLLLGLAAVPASGRELAARRRSEIALARLRGLHGARMWIFLGVEPLLVLVGGAVLGLGVGLIGAGLASRHWLHRAAGGPGGGTLLAVLLVVVVGLVAVLVGMTAALREPLADQVRSAARPQAATTAAIFLSLLVLAGAAVALYRATNHATAADDWVVLAGPALVGLAVGQVTVWLVRLLARWAMGRTAGSGLPAFLAVRRLARTADVATPLRLVVAAGTVAVLALAGAASVDAFVRDSARLRAGAPLQFTLTGARAVDALDLSRALDPAGRHLMAAVLVSDTPEAAARQAYVDTTRYQRVVGDFFAGTPAAGVADHLRQLRTTVHAQVATGSTLTAAVDGLRVFGPAQARSRISIAVDYVDDANTVSTATVRLPVDARGRSATVSVPVRRCSRACVPVQIAVEQAAQPAVSVRIRTLRIGGLDLLGQAWVHGTDISKNFELGPDQGTIRQVGDTATVFVPNHAASGFTPKALRAPLAVLATPHIGFEHPATVHSTGGDERPADVVATVPGLPLVEAGGSLADLSAALLGAQPTVPSARVLVLARADTPAAMLDVLRAKAGAPRTLAGLETATAHRAVASQARAYVLMAGFCLLLALLVVAAWTARQRAEQAREVPGLRVVGVPADVVRRSGWVELLLLALAGVVMATVAGVVAVRGLLVHLPLVRRPAFAVPLGDPLTPMPLLVVAVVLLVIVLGVGSRGRRADARSTRPATLREGGEG